MVSPGSYKEEQGCCAGPQEWLINGCCEVVKGKVAAWGEGETNENGCCRSPRGPQSSHCELLHLQIHFPDSL